MSGNRSQSQSIVASNPLSQHRRKLSLSELQQEREKLITKPTQDLWQKLCELDNNLESSSYAKTVNILNPKPTITAPLTATTSTLTSTVEHEEEKGDLRSTSTSTNSDLSSSPTSSVSNSTPTTTPDSQTRTLTPSSDSKVSTTTETQTVTETKTADSVDSTELEKNIAREIAKQGSQTNTLLLEREDIPILRLADLERAAALFNGLKYREQTIMLRDKAVKKLSKDERKRLLNFFKTLTEVQLPALEDSNSAFSQIHKKLNDSTQSSEVTDAELEEISEALKASNNLDNLLADIRRNKNKLVKKLSTAYRNGGLDFPRNVRTASGYEAQLEIIDSTDVGFVNRLFTEEGLVLYPETRYKLANKIVNSDPNVNADHKELYSECKTAAAKPVSNSSGTADVNATTGWAQSGRLTGLRLECLVHNLSGHTALSPLVEAFTKLDPKTPYQTDIGSTAQSDILLGYGVLSWGLYAAQFIWDFGVIIKSSLNPGAEEEQLSFGTRLWNNLTKNENGRSDRMINDGFWALDNALCCFADHIAPHLTHLAAGLTIAGYLFDLIFDIYKFCRDLKNIDTKIANVDQELAALDERETALRDGLASAQNPRSAEEKLEGQPQAIVDISSNSLLSPSEARSDDSFTPIAVNNVEPAEELAPAPRAAAIIQAELNDIQTRREQLQATREHLVKQRSEIIQTRGINIALSAGLFIGTVLVATLAATTMGFGLLFAFGFLGFAIKCYKRYKENQLNAASQEQTSENSVQENSTDHGDGVPAPTETLAPPPSPSISSTVRCTA